MQAPPAPSSVDLPLAVAPPPVKAPTPRPPPPASLQPESPGVFFSAAAAAAPLGTAHRRIAIAVDLSDESAYAVRWAVANYLRPGDAVILLHVRPTSVLYGADWGAVDVSLPNPSATAASEDGDGDCETAAAARRMEDDYDAFTATKADDFASPLKDAGIPYKIHIVRDHDMKERLCLEVERLSLSAVIMGSKGFGAARRTSKGRLGSVSDYCVHHCVCPVVVVRFPDDGSAEGGEAAGLSAAVGAEDVLHPVPEEEGEYHDAAEEHKGKLGFYSYICLLCMS
ncbi:USP family protein [Zea mays]|jgi:nucleotide-binding universal stress UspA family protein|uniref:USP family protein n=1 Tax=Zea mays TaxID=4577 RepID=A0A1D6IEQ6_MAIZE|nr:USP family protein [Zea mays]